MCDTAKSSITSWWILALMSLFLWYRNEKYDRALSIFIFTLGLIQLIEYGINSGTDPNQSARALYITLWLQCLVLAIGVFVFINSSKDNETPSIRENIINTIAGWNLFLFAIIFVVALIISFTSNTPSDFTNEMEIYASGIPLLGKWGWLYLLGIFIPLVLIFSYYAWADIGIAILILYGILSAVYVLANYPIKGSTTYQGSNVWCYLAVGFSFLAWFIGIIPSDDTKGSIKNIPN